MGGRWSVRQLDQIIPRQHRFCIREECRSLFSRKKQAAAGGQEVTHSTNRIEAAMPIYCRCHYCSRSIKTEESVFDAMPCSHRSTSRVQRGLYLSKQCSTASGSREPPRRVARGVHKGTPSPHPITNHHSSAGRMPPSFKRYARTVP